ncbi:MAG: ring-cleaving dioxygenase [Caldilineaceae bacterium]|nr:ring-cleaving dioxygenase [Caldilineaceae bacterium]
MQLHGIHHVTAVTGDVKQNLHFYTEVLGLRLVKKSVNQDDVSAYHMFYADKVGTPGTDMTFFDWPQTAPEVRGTDSISNTMFRVNGQEALAYWVSRLELNGVQNSGIESFAGRSILRFDDPEGQRLTLVDDQGAAFEGEPTDHTDIPVEFAIRGFYGVELSVPRLAQMEPIFTKLVGFSKVTELPSLDNPNQQVTIYGMDGGGPGKEVHVVEQSGARAAFLGRGGVHHVAFRLKDDEEQQAWLQELTRVGVRTSGLVDRYYFKSVYFRISNGILFELATDGPGFATDEPLETLGERLALPPFLEPRREEIEAGLKPV